MSSISSANPIARLRFESNLAKRGISLEMLGLGDSLTAASPASGLSYVVAPTRTGFSAAAIGKEGKEEIYSGSSKEDAALSCACHEAHATGTPRNEFRHIETGLVLRDAGYLAKGSTYADQTGNKITVADGGQFKAFDRDGRDAGTFTSVKLAQSCLSILEAGTPAKTAAAADEKLDLSFTLEITKRPTLTQTADGYALLILSGEQKTEGQSKARSIPVRGDQARALDQVLGTKKDISEKSPVRIDVTAKLKPQKVFDAGTGSHRMALVAEATEVKLTRSLAISAPGMAA
jgi:hypothetical protein